MPAAPALLPAPTPPSLGEPRGAARCQAGTLRQLFPVQPSKDRRDNPPRRKVPAQRFSLPFTLPSWLLLARPALRSRLKNGIKHHFGSQIHSRDEFVPRLPPLPHQTPMCPTQRPWPRVARRRGCWMRDAGCGVLGAKGASPSSVVHPEDLPGRGQGAGRANGPHRVLQIHRLSHSTVGEHPPTHLTRRKKGGKKPNNQPRRVGKRIGSTSVLLLQAG